MTHRESRVRYFEDLIQPGAPLQKTEYGLFKDSYEDLAYALDSIVSTELSTRQVKNLEVDITGDEKLRMMDHYNELGIITTRMNNFDQTKIYELAQRHGKGFSRSWDDIVDELEEDMRRAEKNVCWRQQHGPDRKLSDYQ